MEPLLILLPLALAACAAGMRSNRARPLILPLCGVVHLALAVHLAGTPGVSGGTDTRWLALDPLGRITMLLVSVLFCLVACYAVGYFRQKGEVPNRVFCACLLIFLGTTSLVCLAQHLGLMWMAFEATALVTAPLIYFTRTVRALEAAWKYLLIGSVGVALALLGTLFLAYASLQGGGEPSLHYAQLLAGAPHLSKPWLHAAFALLLVGYGTKMGVAPMHTWKPDAYGEAPGMVGALLAGGLTSCAFLGLLRGYHICLAAGEGDAVAPLVLFTGLFSMAVAGVFMLGQRDIKRTLAYSSVEQMGVLLVGMGLGAGASFAMLLHMVNNGLTKGALFLSAGNLHRAYGSKSLDRMRGALRLMPLSGTLFLAGFFAITGSPPFGTFISTFSLLGSAFGEGRFWIGGLFLVLLFTVFIGMGATVLAAVQGTPPADARDTPYRDTLLTGGVPLVLLGLVLLLGLWIPGPVETFLAEAAAFLEVRP